MVKKIVALLMLFLAMGGANLYANKQGDPLDLEVKKIDNSPEHPGGPRTPILFPTVWQDGYDLEIEAPHAEYVLNYRRLQRSRSRDRLSGCVARNTFRHL